jgi:hypothetical protein
VFSSFAAAGLAGAVIPGVGGRGGVADLAKSKLKKPHAADPKGAKGKQQARYIHRGFAHRPWTGFPERIGPVPLRPSWPLRETLGFELLGPGLAARRLGIALPLGPGFAFLFASFQDNDPVLANLCAATG